MTTTTNVGRFYFLTEEREPAQGSKIIKYDIVAYRPDNTILKTHIGCLGPQALEFWRDNMIQFLDRLNVLYDALEMQEHNMSCYDKEGYESEYAHAMNQAKMIREWIKEIEEG